MNEQEQWEARLIEEGLSVEAGRSSYLSYGYNNSFAVTAKEQTHKLVSKPRKPTARALVKAAVWGKEAPVFESPDWGYAGGYTPEGRRVKANPTTMNHARIKEELLCAQIAVIPRRGK